MAVLTRTPPRVLRTINEPDSRDKYLERQRYKPLDIPSTIIYRDEDGPMEINTKGMICIQIVGPFLEFYDDPFIYTWSPKKNEVVKVTRND